MNFFKGFVSSCLGALVAMVLVIGGHHYDNLHVRRGGNND